MTQLNVTVTNDRFPELIARVEDTGERIVIEQEGRAIAAIITYADLKRLEALEAALIDKAKLQEYEWLKAAIANPAFDSLRDSAEDIYTLADGLPFHDSEWIKTAIDPNFGSILDPQEDIYTIADGKPYLA
ncbi:MAG: type II toxin-antitoxin system Phd/YefM family antitoxin [Microcoleus sp. PH2017_29_MFU_D_A]|jgi:prevent-host-death family protein|uniref:type II toxin-antitoxin system Phd/YefM family antitoxin n=1 Tax=unclassified Microcoleus TaxID=2642155 RepID=UPI001E0C61DE|nr:MULTISPECIES: type II toxin-antitoxin system Phd/YefM family antitoxin [unclassified Microcoleus]MCC3419844.1 type II toxin-antitoxin system Phd/YefM family antitoxin [Microcoleus sp. PH2017_07_MST_O_A]MCC3430739.1 type II toxin-antitoxin system Phd/YefM family antitoxin [Microcoleus sp. PH2017_04_SCI_O_A]MCC3445420.1 type II toxin-antitoxin system Phd/YefM family antitoxin [Microcoleus sp. PH2017_03_ELD_O_A]MCC3468682.1 type II toxin-antitoxin system Phd/YefM family antitoxin [Microcoleus s